MFGSSQIVGFWGSGYRGLGLRALRILNTLRGMKCQRKWPRVASALQKIILWPLTFLMVSSENPGWHTIWASHAACAVLVACNVALVLRLTPLHEASVKRVSALGPYHIVVMRLKSSPRARTKHVFKAPCDSTVRPIVVAYSPVSRDMDAGRERTSERQT